MTGDSHSNDDSDFLDDDFVVEDIVGKNDDLEDLFDEPAAGPADSEGNATDSDAAASGDPDEDDLLFSDHTEGIEPTEEFQKPTFAEDGDSQWDGERLDLESVGVPAENTEGEDQEAADPELQEAEQSFADELDHMLHDEEDFAIESEDELELVVDGTDDDGVSEFEQSGPFVLDDGDGLWSEDLESAASDDTEEIVLDDGADDTGDTDDTFEVAAEFDEPVVAEEPISADVAATEDFSELPTMAEFGGFGQAEDEIELIEDGEADLVVEEDAGFAPMSAAEQMVGDAFGDNETIVSEGPGAAVPGDEVEEVSGLELLDTAGNDAGGPGWEPLPERSMDGLSEVDEVQRTEDEEYDTSGYEEDEVYEGEEGEESYDEEGYDEAAVAEEGPLEDVEGHDIYGEDSDRAVVLGGPGSQRRSRTLLMSLAASFLFVGIAATLVVRPQWFGLSVEPERVARVNLTRPKVEVAVGEPNAVAVAPVEKPEANKPVAGNPGTGSPETGNPASGNPASGNPAAGSPATGNPKTGNPVAGKPAGGTPEGGEPTTGSQAESPQPTQGAKPVAGPAKQPEGLANGSEQPKPVNQPESAQGTETTLPVQPIAVASKPGQGPAVVKPVGSQPSTTGTGTPTPETSWPVAVSKPVDKPQTDKPALVPFGDGLLVGANKGMKSARAIDGVMPGSRAFAQLHNGNYFIGKVKQVADETITLRLASGEVTLATNEISQLTRLGSSDYDELQKATKGFVRLTNNNRLIGGIISRIADDHVVLEVRKNRVMLPKSVIGEIVSGKEEDSKVRLGTTTEEENWVRTLAERELGSGQGAAPPIKPTGNPSAKPASPTGQPPR